MPDALEYVVRPYTTPDFHGRILIPSTPSGTRERATLTWGATSAITHPTPSEVSEGVNFEVVCCKENLNEIDRKSDTERIYQNNDTTSANWVDVLRPKTLRLKKKDSNHCLGGISLEQISDVIQQVNKGLAEFEAALNSGVTRSHQTCSVTWGFKNK